MPDADATDATIQLIYKTTIMRWAATGLRPTSAPRRAIQSSRNVTAFRRPARKGESRQDRGNAKPKLPVALIFACLVVVYAGFRYFLALMRVVYVARPGGMPRNVSACRHGP